MIFMFLLRVTAEVTLVADIAITLTSQVHFGTIEVGKKADLIGINIDQPHIQPTHNLVNSLVESVNSTDISDMIVNGQVIMKNREVLTLDEEKIMFESKLAMESMSLRAGIQDLDTLKSRDVIMKRNEGYHADIFSCHDLIY